MSTETTTPSSLRNLRACLQCHLLKTFDQFYNSGCENCPFFDMVGDKERVMDCTSPSYEGIVSMMVPTESWVARWNRLIKNVPGCYCISVSGELPEHCLNILADEGLKPRVNPL
eukprot:GILJ01009294.1.p1 GENE.GILJ01009294.1~~GILJ01009294.1.p1  ORF type:complete len:114 (+),score=5.04 GILJ01009294.1:45-386(+)